MPTLTTDAKARDYLAAGRVRAERVDPTTATAVFQVTGSAPIPYRVRYTHGRWACTCPARVICCHVKACALVSPLPPLPCHS